MALKKGWQSCPFFFRLCEVTSRGRNETSRHPAAGASDAFVFCYLPFKTGPQGRFLNVSALRETGPLGCLALESLPPVFVRKPPPSRREALVGLGFFLGVVLFIG